MNYQDAQIVMKDLYETRFGLYDHGGQNKSPLASVLHHDGDETWLSGSLRDIVEEFAVYNMGELYNISLVEYLMLPRPYVALLRKIKTSVLQKREKAISDVERDLEGKRKKERD